MAAPSRARRNQKGRLRLSDNARVVLERRYLAKDAAGNLVETPEQLFRRVAHNIAQAERQYAEPAAALAAKGRRSANGAPPAPEATHVGYEDAFYDLLASLRFLPNSPTLGNAGRPLQQLSACFVLPVEDSMAGIFETVKETALIHQSGGGTGFAFSRLRPAGDIVASSGGVASGPISFMRVFDAATEAIKQGGTRRGANMAILDVRHPDIEAFINLKADMTTLTNFNISVAVDDAFMGAVAAEAEYELVNPRTGEVAARRRARAVFDQIVANAWQNGDPGLVFLDRINRDNPTPRLGRMEATNPCGEQPLLPYESCNLGSLNLAAFYAPASGADANGAADAGEAPSGNAGGEIDWALLGDTVRLAVRFLDDVIDMNAYPIAEIDRMTRLTRKIGLGVMGWADLLFQLGVAYDSEAAIELAGRVMAFIRRHADAASQELAHQRGPFPAWQESIYGPNPPAPRTPSDGRETASDAAIHEGEVRLRNSTRTTVAPTGTLSIIADCSGGNEPVFSLAFTRQHYLDERRPDQPVRLTEVNRHFAAAAREGGFYSDELIDYLAAGGSLRERDDVPDRAKRRFVTAHDIEPDWHVRMQAAFQRHTDNAVSKTINFPSGASTADVAEAYFLAHREGCKGITIYRDGSRAGQVLSHVAEGEGDMAAADPWRALDDLAAGRAATAPAAAGDAPPHRRRLPDERQSLTHKFRVGEQEGYVTVGLFEDGTPGEIFVTISKEGSTIRGLMDSVAMLTSYSLQYGVPLGTLIDKFKGVHFEPAGFTANPEIPHAFSLVDYIFRWLELRFLEAASQSRPPPPGAPRHPGANVAGESAPDSRLTAPAGGPDDAPSADGLSLAPPAAGLRRRGASGRRDAALRDRRRPYLPPRPPLPFREIATGLLCPDCGGQLVFSEGCLVCRACGYTKCG